MTNQYKTSDKSPPIGGTVILGLGLTPAAVMLKEVKRIYQYEKDSRALTLHLQCTAELMRVTSYSTADQSIVFIFELE